ncbi:MAG: hypothetical protein STSR0008_03870 [Ignavibacterium sp.]
MNDESKVIRYLDGQMSDEEKKSFEDELLSSPKLKKLYDEYSLTFFELKNLNEVKINENYFSNLYARFREKNISYKKKKFYYKFAYSLPVLILAVILLLINPFNPSNNEKTSVLSDSIATNYSNENIYKTENTNILKENNTINEKIINEENIEKYYPSYDNEDVKDIYNIINNLSDEELNLLYNELANKEYL